MTKIVIIAERKGARLLEVIKEIPKKMIAIFLQIKKVISLFYCNISMNIPIQ